MWLLNKVLHDTTIIIIIILISLKQSALFSLLIDLYLDHTKQLKYQLELGITTKT